MVMRCVEAGNEKSVYFRDSSNPVSCEFSIFLSPHPLTSFPGPTCPTPRTRALKWYQADGEGSPRYLSDILTYLASACQV